MKATDLRLVLIDDSVEDQEVFLRLLESSGFETTLISTAYTGEEALALCESEPPDCLILDYRLPDIDALDFLRRLARTAQQPPIAVVILTGQGSERIAAEAMKIGAHDYLVKADVTEISLREAILSSIARRQREFGIRQRLSSLTTFVDAMVHDIRAPLTGLGLNVDLLHEAVDDKDLEEIGECAKGIESSYQSLRALLESVHRLIQTEGAAFNSVYFDLRQAVNIACNNLRPGLNTRGVNLKIMPLPSVVSDEPIVAEVIQNVLGNAIAFCARDNPEIIIQGVIDRQNGDQVMAGLVVRDNGPGFSREALASMFEPLWREDSPCDGKLTSSTPNLGLGLSICVRLLSKIGGRIWADNAIDGGAQVFIVLPTRDVDRWTDVANAVVVEPA